MKTSLFPLSLALATCCLLSSCRVGIFTVDSSQRLEAALRGGEADGSIYSDPQWKLTDEAVMELTLEDGRKVYFLPVELSVKTQLDSWFEYRKTGDYGLESGWSSAKGQLTQLPAKKLLIPLRLNSTDDTAREFLASHGVDARIYRKNDLIKPRSRPSTRSYQPSEFPPKGTQMRRIAIPQLDKALRGKIWLLDSYYYTKPNGGVQAAEMALHLLVDVPVALVGFPLGTLYENLFGWMRSDEVKPSQ